MRPSRNAKSPAAICVGVPLMRRLFRAVGARTKADVRALEYGLFALGTSLALIAIYTIIA